MPRLLQVLGPGCYKCGKLAESAEQAAKELALDYRLEKVTDIAEMMKFGVMITPALVVDGTVKVVGRVPSVEEVNYHHLEGGGFKDHPLEVGSVGTRPTPEVVRTL